MVDFYESFYRAIHFFKEKQAMNSVIKECTEFKQKYDACYSVWFTDRFLKGNTSEDTCAPLFASYQQCLKEEYDACFNVWFADKFLKGDYNDSMCSQLLKSYTECVQKSMKEHNIQLKEISSEDFELEKKSASNL